LHQTVILPKEEEYMNIYGHVLYIIIYVYMFILIYIPMKNFFPDLFLFKNSLLIKVLFKD